MCPSLYFSTNPCGVTNQIRERSSLIGPNCGPYKTGSRPCCDWLESRDVRAGHHDRAVRTNPAKNCVEPVVPSSSQGLLVVEACDPKCRRVHNFGGLERFRYNIKVIQLDTKRIYELNSDIFLSWKD